MCKRLRENPSLNGRIDRLHRNITAWPNTVLASFDLAPPQPRQALRILALPVPPASAMRYPRTRHVPASRLSRNLWKPDYARSGGRSDRHLLPTGPIERTACR